MSTPTLEYVEITPSTPAISSIIWLHGLGDSGHGFAPIVPEFKLPDSLAIRFVFPHAPMQPVTINGGMEMRAWYDIVTMDFNNRADRAGVEQSAEAVQALVEAEIARGIPPERIILAGFSQGGVIALHLAARLKQKLAGVIALSTYMCEPESLASELQQDNVDTPIFMAHGEHDDVVPVFMGKAAFDTLQQNGFNATWETYPIQHNVCMPEVNSISQFIQACLQQDKDAA